MNDTNPFIPQGSLLEQKNKKRARVKVAVLAIFGFNALLICALLTIPACKHGDQAENGQDTNTTPTDLGSTQPTNVAPGLNMSNTLAAATNLQQPPVAQPPPQIPVAVETQEYVVLPKDTYTSIAKKFAPVTVKALEAANPDIPATKLMPGKKIKIPAATGPMAVAGGASDSENTYVVKPNDNLTKIAIKYNTSIKALQDLNNLKSTKITAGQKLKVPVKVAGALMDSGSATTTASNPMPAPAPTMR